MNQTDTEQKSLSTTESYADQMSKREVELEMQIHERDQRIASLEKSLAERDEASLTVSLDNISDDMVICENE